MDRSPIYIPPKNFADYLHDQQDYCLFLDIDGTLAEFTLDPKHTIIPDSTLTLLQAIQDHGVQIVAITGRGLAEAQQLLSPLRLPIAATHGLEIDWEHNKNSSDSVKNAYVDIAELAAIKQAVNQACLPYDDFIIEDKPYSVALHYRKNPTLAEVAHAIMLAVSKAHSNWILKPGKYVWEIAPKQADKGVAILALLEKLPNAQYLCPIFIGDDITDEAGFKAVQKENSAIEGQQGFIKGIGIKVGSESTCAHYYVHDIHDVESLLSSFLTFCKKRISLV